VTWQRSVLILASSCLAGATPLWSDGVAVHNGSAVAWRIQRNQAYGDGHYLAYLETPAEAASRDQAWGEAPDWMDIDFPTPGYRPELVLEPGQTLRIDLIGNDPLQEGFSLLDPAGHRRGSFFVSRPAPKAGRPFHSELFFTPRSAGGLVAFRFQARANLLRILDAGAGPERRGSLEGSVGGAGSAFSTYARRVSITETKEETKGPPAED
jgi:hypothetical protein